MRRGTRLLLWSALGAVVGLLAVFFVAERPNANVGVTSRFQGEPQATVPASAAGPLVRARAAADDPSSDTAVERDVGDSANEAAAANVAATESQTVVPTNTGGDFAARAAPSIDRLAATPSHGSNDTAPLSWCFRARSGFTWQEEPSGSAPRHGLSSDTSFVWQGSASARIRSVGDSTAFDVVGVMWQGVAATPFRGKRVEMSAYVRPRFTRVGHLFVRTQAKVPLELLVSDQGAPGARGVNQYVPRNAEWERYSVVHDVPDDAEVMYFGFALYGGGFVSIDDVRISIVAETTPLSHYGSVAGNPGIAIDPSWILPTPLNLDFELTNDGPTGGAEVLHPDCTRESAE